MPDGALHAGRCGRERARDLRIEHLRDRIDDVHIVHRDHDRLAQILITLDVRRHADLMDDRSDKRLDVGVIAPRGCLFSSRHHLADPVCHGPAVARLAHKILHAKLRRHRPDIFGHKPGHHQCPRRALQLTAKHIHQGDLTATPTTANLPSSSSVCFSRPQNSSFPSASRILI